MISSIWRESLWWALVSTRPQFPLNFPPFNITDSRTSTPQSHSPRKPRWWYIPSALTLARRPWRDHHSPWGKTQGYCRKRDKNIYAGKWRRVCTQRCTSCVREPERSSLCDNWAHESNSALRPLHFLSRPMLSRLTRTLTLRNCFSATY